MAHPPSNSPLLPRGCKKKKTRAVKGRLVGSRVVNVPLLVRDTPSYNRTFGPDLYTVLLVGVTLGPLESDLECSIAIRSGVLGIHPAIATMTAIIYGEWAPSNPFPYALHGPVTLC